jgi:hypothetical protein
MTESQEKPLATWLMENIVKGDGSEYLGYLFLITLAIIENENLAKDDRFVYSFCIDIEMSD